MMNLRRNEARAPHRPGGDKMFDHSSRYYGIDTASYPLPDGQIIAYARRRFLPQGESLQVLAEIMVTPDDRIDLIASRVYGDPLAFWRLCDANNAMDPLDMMADAAADPTRRLRAALPQS